MPPYRKKIYLHRAVKESSSSGNKAFFNRAMGSSFAKHVRVVVNLHIASPNLSFDVSFSAKIKRLV